MLDRDLLAVNRSPCRATSHQSLANWMYCCLVSGSRAVAAYLSHSAAFTRAYRAIDDITASRRRARATLAVGQSLFSTIRASAIGRAAWRYWPLSAAPCRALMFYTLRKHP